MVWNALNIVFFPLCVYRNICITMALSACQE